MTRTVWIITGIFLLAAGVVAFVLWQTKSTLKDAQVAADKAGKVTGDIKDLGFSVKKVWSDAKDLFGSDSQ